MLTAGALALVVGELAGRKLNNEHNAINLILLIIISSTNTALNYAV